MHVCRARLQVQIRLSSSQEDAFIHAKSKKRCCGLEGGRWDWTAPLHSQMCNLCASCVTAPLSTDRVSNGLQNSTSKRTDSSSSVVPGGLVLDTRALILCTVYTLQSAIYRASSPGCTGSASCPLRLNRTFSAFQSFCLYINLNQSIILLISAPVARSQAIISFYSRPSICRPDLSILLVVAAFISEATISRHSRWSSHWFWLSVPCKASSQ